METDLIQVLVRAAIRLTPTEAGRDAVRLPLSELLAYEEEQGFTRLRLKGGKVMDVLERGDHIDRVVRCAANDARP